MKAGRPALSALERFGTKIQLDWETDCWNWIGAISPAGYGIFTDDNGKNVIAHRFGYETILEKPIPGGHDVHHLCRNRKCVCPDHLKAESRDAHAKHHKALRTNCPNNHCYEEVGFTISVVNGNQWRHCNECAKNNWKKTNEKRKLARKAKPLPPPRTHCKKGLHELTPENIAISNGKPTCKPCWDAAKARYKEKHKSPNPRGTPKAFCKHNHAMTPENTHVYRGRKSCKRCNLDRANAHRRKMTFLDMPPKIQSQDELNPGSESGANPS